MREVWSTDEERIVEPGIFAVCGCLKLRSSLEVERGVALGIFTTPDNASVAYVDIDTIVSLDAVDSLQFRTVQSLA